MADWDVGERVRQIQDLIATASLEWASEDRAVTVVVGPGGAVRDLRLGSRAFQLTGVDLGALVTATIREANDHINQQISDALAEITGGRGRSFDRTLDMPTPAQLRAELDGPRGDG